MKRYNHYSISRNVQIEDKSLQIEDDVQSLTVTEKSFNQDKHVNMNELPKVAMKRGLDKKTAELNSRPVLKNLSKDADKVKKRNKKYVEKQAILKEKRIAREP